MNEISHGSRKLSELRSINTNTPEHTHITVTLWHMKDKQKIPKQLENNRNNPFERIGLSYRIMNRHSKMLKQQ